MPLFRFKTADPAGNTTVQLVEGDSQADAARRLQHRGLIPLECLGDGTAAGPSRFRRGRFDLVDFTDRLVPLVQAGIPLEQALGIVADEREGAATGEPSIAADLRRGLHEGRKLSQLMRDRRHAFPEFYVGLVEAGEESGALATVLVDLRSYLIRRRELRNYLLTSSIYPALVLTVSLVVLSLLLGLIVPKFATMLDTAGVRPTLSTRFLIALSGLVRGYWWLAILALAGTGVGLRLAYRSPGGRAWFDRWLVRLPYFGQIALWADLGRLARTMSILMRSGVHILETVAISSRVLGNTLIRESLASISTDLRRGERLARALSRVAHVPPYMIKMVVVGEETGNVEQMLERVADRFDADLKTRISRGLSLLEPALIVVLGIVVGAIVVTMFLAIMQLQGALG